MVWEQLLPRAVCARVCLNDSSGVADLQPWPRTAGADGVGLHLELCQGERFLFHCRSSVVSGDGPVSAVNASTKHLWRKTGFQSAFIEVGKKSFIKAIKASSGKRSSFLLKPTTGQGRAFAPAAELQLCQAQPGTWCQPCCPSSGRLLHPKWQPGQSWACLCLVRGC